MANPTQTDGSTVITQAEPVAHPTPEATLFAKTTPAAEPAPDAAATPVAKPDGVVTPPEEPADPKSPTEPPKEPANPAAPVVPKDTDLKLPDGALLREEDLTSIRKEYLDGKITKDQADQRIQASDLGAKAFKANQDQMVEQTRNEWKEAVKRDPDMGGEKLAETALLASRAFKAVASPQLQVWAEQTGMGDHPEVVRMMVKIGKLIGEDKLVTGTTGTAPVARSREEILFGKTTPKT